MHNIVRADSAHPDFQQLVVLLDKELAERDGSEHAFYAQYNKIDMIKNAVIAYDHELPVACGAFKLYEENTVEIKRMYVLPLYRGKGFAVEVLQAIEVWAIENGFEKAILETGLKQPEAIRLYQKSGYTQIPNYGQYAGVANSVCMEKKL